MNGSSYADGTPHVAGGSDADSVSYSDGASDSARTSWLDGSTQEQKYSGRASERESERERERETRWTAAEVLPNQEGDPSVDSPSLPLEHARPPRIMLLARCRWGASGFGSSIIAVFEARACSINSAGPALYLCSTPEPDVFDCPRLPQSWQLCRG